MLQSSKQISRRSIATGLAVAVASIPTLGLLGASLAKGRPGELAALIRRYNAEVDPFNSAHGVISKRRVWIMQLARGTT